MEGKITEGQISGENMETAVSAFSAVWCVTVLFFIYRMWEAHKLRIGIMKEDLDTYLRLPPYSEMVFKFWRPLSWFVKKTSEDKPEKMADLPE